MGNYPDHTSLIKKKQYKTKRNKYISFKTCNIIINVILSELTYVVVMFQRHKIESSCLLTIDVVWKTKITQKHVK